MLGFHPNLPCYRYDTLGRRVETTKADQTQRLWQYSQAGQLMFGWTGPNNPTTHEYVYLAGSLVAIVDHAGPDNAVTAVKYQHTDALGSLGSNCELPLHSSHVPSGFRPISSHGA